MKIFMILPWIIFYPLMLIGLFYQAYMSHGLLGIAGVVFGLWLLISAIYLLKED